MTDPFNAQLEDSEPMRQAIRELIPVFQELDRKLMQHRRADAARWIWIQTLAEDFQGYSASTVAGFDPGTSTALRITLAEGDTRRRLVVSLEDDLSEIYVVTKPDEAPESR